MNRISKLFAEKSHHILNVYFTAGYPELKDTVTIIKSLVKSGADIIEIGMPYSDPVADGETIQESNQIALNNGMSIRLLFEQIKNIRQEGVKVPILLMGYFNPVYQYGVEDFCKKCKEVGVDGLIIPDLPFDEFKTNYKKIFNENGLFNIFLITPQTTNERILAIDDVSEGFVYMVSSASVTGKTSGISPEMMVYFNRVNNLALKNPRLIGFGIKDKESFEKACEFASGAIIGSQFIRVVTEGKNNLEESIATYIYSIKA